MKKIECDLPACSVKFVPVVKQQRFCSQRHHDKFHQLERTHLIHLARAMGIRK